MPSGRKIVLEIGKERAIAVLLDDQAPKTCDAIWNALPYETESISAVICQHELIFMMPLIIDMENPKFPTVGDIGYWCPRQCVNIWYDKTEPLGLTNLFAKIVENLDGFAKEAKKVWKNPGTRVKLYRLE
ncbi:MAG: DUF3830 family protein [Candidatus Bathyarchaeia archaeon]